MKNTKFIFTTIFTLFFITFSYAQTNDFDSGSTGADGDLVFDVANGANQVFDHLADGHEGVWNFNFIVIPAGVTVRFPTPLANSTPPVIWFATGDIEISGTLDLRGQNGNIGSGTLTIGSEPKGGPGGFAGGISAGSGYGPGGGRGASAASNQGLVSGASGTFLNVYGNRFLQPLTGGSGGGGALNTNSAPSLASGGGGGGAILLSSSTQIIVDGVINCNGGSGPTHSTDKNDRAQGGSGSGGGIRLIADRIEGTGTVSAAPNGRIAIEAFDVSQMNVSANPFTYYLNVKGETSFLRRMNELCNHLSTVARKLKNTVKQKFIIFMQKVCCSKKLTY